MVNAMNADYQKIKEDLSVLGLCKGDAVLVHSSFKSMGAVEGGIQTLVDALLSVIGDSGTKNPNPAWVRSVNLCGTWTEQSAASTLPTPALPLAASGIGTLTAMKGTVPP